MQSKLDMTRMTMIAAASVLGIAVAGMANAQPNPLSPSSTPEPSATPSEISPAPGEEYSKLDTNKDGKISRAEARKNKDLVKKWSSLDANKDGSLDEGEFAKFEAEPPSSPAKPAEPAKPATE